MTTRITLDAFSGRKFAGKVRRIAPYVLDLAKQARTVDIEVDFVDQTTFPSCLQATAPMWKSSSMSATIP
jgi:HlyD family secretion protein